MENYVNNMLLPRDKNRFSVNLMEEGKRLPVRIQMGNLEELQMIRKNGIVKVFEFQM